MKLVKGSRVAFTAAFCKDRAASSAQYAGRRGTYQGEYAGAVGYCRVVWDDAASRNLDDSEYREMSMTLGELHPVKIICGVKSAAFGDTYATNDV